MEKLILRIPVQDQDLAKTPNWVSKFVITKGNENENFRVDTDPKTNEGLLYVSKVSWSSCCSQVLQRRPDLKTTESLPPGPGPREGQNYNA